MVLSCAVGIALVGQSVRAQAPDPSYGVDGATAYTVSAWDGQPDTSGMTWAYTGPVHRYQTSPGTFLASVHLPEGASIQGIELEACDAANPGYAEVVLLVAGVGTIGYAGTGDAETPGCNRFNGAVSHTVSNTNNHYLLNFQNTSHDGTTSIGAIRIYYKLQVSPAPLVATFADVPTSHPFFQFVEALAASGISAGCGSGNFCPNTALTRGQMAVFLAKALGLHWPN